jgi:energy-coupling factor transporter ATP-binding protein EcfA2
LAARTRVRLLVANFKSVDELELELGRTNLFIGANGCGKSTILEAVGMLAASVTDALSNAAIKDRGIRVAESVWMRSAFTAGSGSDPIVLGLGTPGIGYVAYLVHDNSPYGQWTNKLQENASAAHSWVRRALRKVPDPQGITSPEKIESVRQYICYAPSEDVLRDLARESDVEPIGIHGEGLFKLLQVLEAEEQLPLVKEHLALLDWFDDISVAAGVNPSSRSLQIRDVFLQGNTPFDQRSANEGFLFVLLYACLLISKYTPKFFAVDNVDTALNPKLAARTVKMFAELTKQYDRRVLLTAHNPGALDGLDLNDDEQRLFVVYRNIEGRTRVRRILPADLPAGEEPVRLSEAFLRGYLGALPTNF